VTGLPGTVGGSAGLFRGLAAVTLAVALLVASGAAVAQDGTRTKGGERPDPADAASPAAAPPESLAQVAGPTPVRTAPSMPRPPTAPEALPFAGDVRQIRSEDLGFLVSTGPGVRFVGSGWTGHHVSAARGALPATLTGILLERSRFDDWIDGGTDLLAASVVASGAPSAPSGRDLSLWPSYVAEAVTISPAEGVRSAPSGAGLEVGVWPHRLPGDVPFSRVTLGIGSFDWSVLGVEFGMRAGDGRIGLQGAYDQSDGVAPSPGGHYDIQTLGGRFSIGVGGGWSADFVGIRATLERGVPFEGSTVPRTERDYVRSEISIGATDGRSLVQVFSADSWLADGRTGVDGGDLRCQRLGVRGIVLLGLGWLEGVRWRVERRDANGSLLELGSETVGIDGGFTSGFDLASGRLALAAGLDYLGGRTFPTANVSFRAEGDVSAWWLGADLGGRHPTILERRMTSVAMPTADGVDRLVRGRDGLDPEIATVVHAGYRRDAGWGRWGAVAEAVRVGSPIALSEIDGDVIAPGNAPAETGGGLSAWTALGESAGRGGYCVVDLTGLDPDGALNALEPVPVATVRAAGWVPWWVFNDYLRTRWELSARYETGLARGPWDGTIDDSSVALDAAVVATAGPARMFVSVRDIFGSASARVPWRKLGDTTISAGFSWDFWN